MQPFRFFNYNEIFLKGNSGSIFMCLVLKFTSTKEDNFELANFVRFRVRVLEL